MLLAGTAGSSSSLPALLVEGPPSGVRGKLGYYWFEFRWRVRQVSFLGEGRVN